MSRLPLTLAALAACALFAACSSTPVAPVAEAGKPTTPAATPSAPARPGAGQPVPESRVAAVALPAHRDPANALSKDRSVFFEFDEIALRSEFLPLVERHGQYLRQHPEFTIRVEGHADERGSAEYNLALGQRRAESVLRVLRLQGARDAQMEAVSYGEEKPRATGHDDGAWAQNRRADIAYR
ncbi:peptidoglycan-associated lipoprotein Pal [Aquabacterium humicola]|uniref:peptidoglycan-associated lipoprotein Pal n=1 Tax=Aquabacterium humicola TaxID=3237377 RepID=UPI0025433AF9|nr:peptidoglycan-associated lipoprotein Pal [Rubrivivax pictus]